ncbi:pyridoxamine 5'-phosphate oxidase family protein [Streptomyces sp. NPDC005531]|uniref:pyridoxamine 5'-phosphate oxidase family protein n=1 Tax=Streptomyces sp. NPDC005531 TaxID=3364722 RepID=UPI003690852C
MIWVSRDGEELLISTEQGRRKERNILRDPRVGLTVFDLADPHLYVEIRGTATVTEDVDRAVAVHIAEEYLGPGGGKEYLEARRKTSEWSSASPRPRSSVTPPMPPEACPVKYR